MVLERGSKEQLGIDLLFLNKSILNKYIYSIFLFAYNSQLNYTCLSNVLFK